MASAASIGAVPGIGHAQDPPCEQGGGGSARVGWLGVSWPKAQREQWGCFSFYSSTYFVLFSFYSFLFSIKFPFTYLFLVF